MNEEYKNLYESTNKRALEISTKFKTGFHPFNIEPQNLLSKFLYKEHKHVKSEIKKKKKTAHFA